METKTGKVLEHLKKHGCITQWEAIKEYGATRLSAIIFNLKKRGLTISSIWQEDTDRYGNKSRYVNYFLEDNNE